MAPRRADYGARLPDARSARSRLGPGPRAPPPASLRPALGPAQSTRTSEDAPAPVETRFVLRVWDPHGPTQGRGRSSLQCDSPESRAPWEVEFSSVGPPQC